MFHALVIATLFAYVYAQSECEKAWTSIASDPAASTCLSIQQFLPVTTAAQNNASLVTPITNWLTSLCSQPECSKDTLSAIYKSVTTKCPPPEQWAFLEPTLYPTERKFLCLKNASGTLCATETLTNVESFSGRILSFVDFQKIFENLPATMPANITCTNCIKAGYNIIAKAVPSAVTSSKPAFQSLCGAAFVDGQEPTGITQGANTATATAATTLKVSVLKGLALSHFSQNLVMGLTASAFVLVSTMYTILA